MVHTPDLFTAFPPRFFLAKKTTSRVFGKRSPGVNTFQKPGGSGRPGVVFGKRSGERFPKNGLPSPAGGCPERERVSLRKFGKGRSWKAFNPSERFPSVTPALLSLCPNTKAAFPENVHTKCTVPSRRSHVLGSCSLGSNVFRKRQFSEFPRPRAHLDLTWTSPGPHLDLRISRLISGNSGNSGARSGDLGGDHGFPNARICPCRLRSRSRSWSCTARGTVHFLR